MSAEEAVKLVEALGRTMPRQKPHRSVQKVRTPLDLVMATQYRFGDISVDLAATEEDRVVPSFVGPGSAYYTDALAETCLWHLIGGSMLRWLNPPFANIAPWVAKCVAESAKGARIAVLVPAAVGSRWFNLYVRPYAYVLELTPRVTFVGHATAYPKDLLLCYYSRERMVGREAWEWKPKAVPAPANDNGVDPRQLVLPEVNAA